MSSTDQAAGTREPRGSFGIVLTDGLYAGIIGAAIVAIWFLILDTLAGHPLHTPTLLGSWLIRGPESIAPGYMTPDPPMIAAYTAVHVVAFVIVGTFASYLFTLFDRHPAAGIGLVFLFVFFEVGFFIFSAVQGGGILGRLGAWAVGVGNLLSAAGMATYLWIRHPHLKDSLEHIWDQ
jgi:hypothetical protein